MAPSQDEEQAMTCPFCGYEALDSEYAMLLHMETLHAEGQSPFVVQDADGDGKDEVGHLPVQKVGEEDSVNYTPCPFDGCGEWLPAAEVADHLQLHADAEALDEEDATQGSSSAVLHGDDTAVVSDASQSPPMENGHNGDTPPPPRPPTNSSKGREQVKNKTPRQDKQQDRSAKTAHSTRQMNAIKSWRNILNMPAQRSKNSGEDKLQAGPTSSAKGKRLGKAELGRYAHEQQMPEWLVTLLRKGGQIKAEGVIRVLQQLLEQSPSTTYAYLCHPSVQHISKLRKEGGFCGYRNIQMMSSYIIGTGSTGSKHFKKKIPSIFQIQDYIEEAWDMGINSQGRVETGGIKGTRKYIGTPEALAMLRRLEIPCDAQGFKKPGAGESETLLYASVERYFQDGLFDPGKKVRVTNLPPIYFQHAGHSMTIVGIERTENDGYNLLVFDPMFHDPAGITRLIGRDFSHRFPDLLLKPYRRGGKYLKKYREFELLRLKPPDAS